MCMPRPRRGDRGGGGGGGGAAGGGAGCGGGRGGVGGGEAVVGRRLVPRGAELLLEREWGGRERRGLGGGPRRLGARRRGRGFGLAALDAGEACQQVAARPMPRRARIEHDA